MPETAEPVDPPAHDSDQCPFCPIKRDKEELTSYIGKDNDSAALGRNLGATGDDKKDHLYVDSVHGTYSAEAHHLICGNEVLKEEGTMERYLIEQGKSSSKGGAGYLKPNDVGYNVNDARNGIWLPSVPYEHMAARGKPAPERWWGDQTQWNRKNPSKPPRVSLEHWEKIDIAFKVMWEVKRQFHKGSHGSVGTPEDNYVRMAIKRLRQLSVLVEHFSEECPMKEDGSALTEPPFYPPYGAVGMLNALSAELARELQGSPETWNYFISELARECGTVWKAAT
jgi:hypothetical protein